MPTIHHPHIRNFLLDGLDQDDASGSGSGHNSAQEVVNSVRSNKANGQQYPYPSSSLGADPTFETISNIGFTPNPLTPQGAPGSAQTPVQVSQPELPTFATSSVSTVTSSTSSSVSSSTSISSSSWTSSGSTLRVPPPAPHPSTTSPPSLIVVTQTFSYTEPSATELSNAPSDEPQASGIHIPPVALGLLIGVGGVVLLIVCACAIRCIRQQRRHKRRRKESAAEFVDKNAWDDTSATGGRTGEEGNASPSTIFGGRERTGLTPQPSWTTFHDAATVGTFSPYPLGLLPPPATSYLAPSWRAQGANGQGFPHSGFNPGHYVGGGANHQPYAAPFEPPTITITSSSPRQSSQNLPDHPTISRRHANNPPPASSSQSDTSSGNSHNRVSVYTDPVHGTRLMKPPRLAVVNNDPSVSESDGGPRNSGWSSWDDNVGLELGVTIDRKLAPPRRKSRIPVSKAKGCSSPLRVTFAPVQEESDTEATKFSPRKPLATSTARLHPQSPNQRQHHPSSPASLQRSPRAARSTSPRALKGGHGVKQAQTQRLYDLPQISANSPGGNESTRAISPSSIPASPVRELDHDSNFSKRRSKRASKRASSIRSPSPARPSSVGSYALSETYTYVYSHAFSSAESEEIQVRSTSKRTSARKQEGGNVDRRFNRVASTSPAVSDIVGALMMKAYDEEEAIPSPSLPRLKEKKERDGIGGKVQGNKKHAFGESSRVNIPKSAMRSGVTNPNQKPRQQQSAAGTSTRQPKRAATPASRDADTHLSGGDCLSAQSVYSEHPGHPPPSRSVPSLPPPGMPNLYQLKLMREMPDYRSPTYSLYGMYRDENSVSPLQDSPVEYRYASSVKGGPIGAWGANVI